MSTRLALLVLFLIILAVLPACSRDRNLLFTIYFDSPGGLAAGDMVVNDGIAIGRVINIREARPSGVLVDVKIFKSYRDRLTTGSIFTIRNVHPGLSARPRIEIKVTDPSAEPLPPGYEAKGSQVAGLAPND